jgi:hypothetical protein
MKRAAGHVGIAQRRPQAVEMRLPQIGVGVLEKKCLSRGHGGGGIHLRTPPRPRAAHHARAEGLRKLGAGRAVGSIADHDLVHPAQ